MLGRYAVSIGSRVVGAIGQAVFLIALARAFTPAEVGVFGATFASCLFIMSIVDFGMVTRALRLSEEPAADGYRGFIAITRSVLTVLLPILIVGLTIYLPDQQSTMLLILGAAVFAIGESNGELANSLWQGMFKPGYVALAVSVRRVFAIVPLAFGVTETNAVIGMLANGVIGSLALAWALWGRIGRPRAASAVLRENTPFALATAGPLVAQLDSVVVAATAGASTAGVYSLATRLNAPLNLLIATLVQVFVPELVRQPSDTDRLVVFRRVRRLVLVLAAGIASLAFAAPWITEVLFGPAYAAGQIMVAGAIVGSALSGVSQLHLAWFYGTVTPLPVATMMLVWGVLNLVLVGLLGASAGIAGLALAYVLSQGMLSLAIYLFWRRATRELR